MYIQNDHPMKCIVHKISYKNHVSVLMTIIIYMIEVVLQNRRRILHKIMQCSHFHRLRAHILVTNL